MPSHFIIVIWTVANEFAKQKGKTNNEQCIFTSNCQLYCPFSLVHKFVRSGILMRYKARLLLRRDAQGVCQAERSLMSPLVGMK